MLTIQYYSVNKIKFLIAKILLYTLMSQALPHSKT
jgi:hypothetical protein